MNANLTTVLLALACASCAQPPPSGTIGSSAKGAKPVTASSGARISSQSAAQPGQCMGLIGGERDQCLQRYGSSGAGASSASGSAPGSR